MGNTISYLGSNISNDQLNTFEIKEIPKFENIVTELNSKTLSNADLYKLFQKCCFISVTDFQSEYPSVEMTKCFQSNVGWYFRCIDCSNHTASCFCSKCFLSNPIHFNENHKFSFFESKTAVCDCGFDTYIKSKGFCKTHKHCNDEIRIEKYLELPSFLKLDLHLFFRYVLLYLMMSTKDALDFGLMKTKLEDNKNLKTILSWLSDITFQSTTLVHVLSEELVSYSLDDYDISKPFDSILNPRDQAYKDPSPELDPYYHKMVGYISRLRKRGSVLSYLFLSHHSTGFVNEFTQLLRILIENHEHFKCAYFSELIMHFYDIYLPRDKFSSSFLTFSSGYMVTLTPDILTLAMSDSKYNLLEVILSSHKLFMPMLEPFYKVTGYKKETFLQSNFDVFTNLTKNCQVVEFLFSQPHILKELFELALAIHLVQSPEFVNPSCSTTKFLVVLEREMIKSLKNIMEHIYSDKLSKPKDYYINTLIDLTIEYLGKLKFPALSLEKIPGFLLSSRDTFEKSKHLDLYIHCPLIRMLSVLMIDNHSNIDTITKKLSKELLIHISMNIIHFRVTYSTYDPDDKNLAPALDFYITDNTLTLDMFWLRFAIISLGPNAFLYMYFDTLSGLKFNNNTTSFYEVFAFFCAFIQVDSKLEPTKDDLIYHLAQCILTGKFEVEKFMDINRLYFGKDEEIAKALMECVENFNVKKLLPSLSNLYDPNYRFFSYKYSNSFRGLSKTGYQKFLGKDEKYSIPPPIHTKPLVGHLLPLCQLFNSGDCIILGLIYYVLAHYCYIDAHFENGLGEMFPDQFFEICKRLFKPDAVINEVLYLFTIITKLYQNSIYSNLSNNEKLLIQNEIQQFINNNNDKVNQPNSSNNDDKVNQPNNNNNNNNDKVNQPNSSNNDDKVNQPPNNNIFLKNLFKRFNSNDKEIPPNNNNNDDKVNPPNQNNNDDVDIVNQPNNSIFIKNLFKRFNIIVNSKNNMKLDLSIIDILLNIYQKLTVNNKILKSLLEFIFDTIIDFNNNFKDYLTNHKVEYWKSPDTSISISPSPSKSIIDNYNNNNNNNNNNIQKVKEEQVVIEEEKVVRKRRRKKVVVEYEECCSICFKKMEIPMKFGYIENSTLPQKLLNQYLDSLDGEIPSRFLNFLDEFQSKEATTGVLQYVPDRYDLPQLYALFIFNRSTSTYITTCGHSAHEDCIKFPTGGSLSTGFFCPICLKDSNLLIPTSGTHSMTDPKNHYELYYQTLCSYDFYSFLKNQEKSLVLERYLWKFVLNNIETLEIKSRKLNYLVNYQQSESDKSGTGNSYYYAIEQDQFNKELNDLLILYRSIMECGIVCHNQLPIYDPLVYLTDTFTAATYSHYLTKANPVEYLNKLERIEIFKILLFQHYKEMDGKDISFTSIKLFIEKIQQILKMDRDCQNSQLYRTLSSMVFPMLRKMLIFNYIYQNKDIKPSLSFNLNIDQFNDYSEISNKLKFNLIEFILDLDWIPLANDFLGLSSTPKGNQIYGIYPPSSPIEFVPHFSNSFGNSTPKTMVEYIEQTIKKSKPCRHCKSLPKYMCIICGLRLCGVNTCQNVVNMHWSKCQSLPLSILMPLSTPFIEILREQFRAIVLAPYNPKFQLYIDPKNQQFNDQTYYFPTQLNSTLQLEPKTLIHVYKLWINSSYFK
ncbi:RING zinc finger-containing protein [Tieghemostelium lacteum]|uniref:E3 ubiquitin-protein ligase n=1 Tax=Tieghemostelium lacteum TaxID=361077 RepID=A0A152A2H9_TIELA|nr:RING zinc finger-containing protein [Tieghemostelium lacteum]|eukprot:KYR00410.1 RING zinc finger-containing protein [Tieghemostelium lacteum]